MSFMSESRGTVGVEVSSSVRLSHESRVDAPESVKLPRTPISEEVPSPTNRRSLDGSQARRVTTKQPGGLTPGKGK